MRPGIHLKCFTAVEIAFFADHYGKTDEQVLVELREAGLDSLPGGGAEIFAPRVRRKISYDKCDGDRYLSVHRTAHRLGMRTNMTMLYGHIETMAERVDHMLQVRALQDETGGLQAFIPLAFHNDNNQMRKLPAPTGTDTLRTHAVARLLLDNVDHIKAYWISSRRRSWRRRRCGSAPTTSTAPCRKRPSTTWPDRRRRRALSTDQIERLIRDAGREPIERDTLYNVVRVPGRRRVGRSCARSGSSFQSCQTLSAGTSGSRTSIGPPARSA